MLSAYVYLLLLIHTRRHDETIHLGATWSVFVVISRTSKDVFVYLAIDGGELKYIHVFVCWVKSKVDIVTVFKVNNVLFSIL